MSRALASYIGERYGYLTVVDSLRTQSGVRKRGYFKVRCDCGSEKTILAHNLLQGRTKSCGCKTSELKGWNVRHGMCYTRIYKIYVDMRQRCLNPSNRRFYRYGGRGIKICDEWIEDFMAFYQWAISNGYRDDLSIERVNNNGNYEPANCTWATMEEQLKNRDFSQVGRNRKRAREAAINE